MIDKCEQCKKVTIKYRIIEYTNLNNDFITSLLCEECKDKKLEILKKNNDEFGFSITPYTEQKEMKPITI